MPRIPVHTVDSAPDDSRDPLKVLEAKFGKVLNIHGEMAHSPVVLQSYAALQNVITDYGTFDPRTREAIALAVGKRRPLHLLPVSTRDGRQGRRPQ